VLEDELDVVELVDSEVVEFVSDVEFELDEEFVSYVELTSAELEADEFVEDEVLVESVEFYELAVELVDEVLVD
jgi:hypothetical protein